VWVRSIQIHGGEVVLEELVHEAVAIADALEEDAIGAVVEEEVVAGWGDRVDSGGYFF
jgi:hypothetical protein